MSIYNIYYLLERTNVAGDVQQRRGRAFLGGICLLLFRVRVSVSVSVTGFKAWG